MGRAYGGVNSGEDQDATNSQERRHYRRFNNIQIASLEAVFRDCPHPNERLRLEVSRQLSLEPCQVKFWFQNRRAKARNKVECVDNNMLRAENESIRSENAALRDSLRNLACPSCGPLVSENTKQLELKNTQLRQELERLKAAATYSMEIPSPDLPVTPYISTSD